MAISAIDMVISFVYMLSRAAKNSFLVFYNLAKQSAIMEKTPYLFFLLLFFKNNAYYKHLECGGIL